MIMYLCYTPKEESKLQETYKEIEKQETLEEKGVFISYIDL